MVIVLDNLTLKVVAAFESNKSETVIRDYFVNTIWANLEPKIDTKMTNNFEVGWTKEKDLRLFEISPNHFEMYPKLWISGTTNLTEAQLNTGISNLLKELKDQMKADVITQNVTNLLFHVHYSDGRADEVDEF